MAVRDRNDVCETFNRVHWLDQPTEKALLIVTPPSVRMAVGKLHREDKMVSRTRTDISSW